MFKINIQYATPKNNSDMFQLIDENTSAVQASENLNFTYGGIFKFK